MPEPIAILTPEQKETLLKLARASIAAHFGVALPALPKGGVFDTRFGIFVSLHKGHELRGCIGYIQGYKPLAASVVEMAQAAAFHDPRFPSLSAGELPQLCIEISVLSELLPMAKDELPVIGRDGLYIRHPYGSGLLLPQVAVEWHWDAATFLQEVCRKAGLPRHAYRDDSSNLFRFTAEVFSESDTF